jgi:hypothetical protein
MYQEKSGNPGIVTGPGLSNQLIAAGSLALPSVNAWRKSVTNDQTDIQTCDPRITRTKDSPPNCEKTNL